MFKHTDAPGQATGSKPLIRNLVHEAWENHKVKGLLEKLEPLNLSKNDLVIINGSKAVVIPEKTFGQLEELGKMSLRLDSGRVCELDLFAVGKFIGDDIRIVKEFVLPSEDNVLAIKRGYGQLKFPESTIDLVYLLRNVENSRIKPKPEHQEFFQWVTKEALVRSDITPEKLFETRWEMISNANSSAHTKNYLRKVVNEGECLVFCIHIHSEINECMSIPTNFDVIHYAESDSISWFGILHVPDETRPQDFRFSREKLSVYYSPAGDSKWVKKGKHDFDLSKGPQEFKKFEEHQKALVKTYGELLELNGKHKQD